MFGATLRSLGLLTALAAVACGGDDPRSPTNPSPSPESPPAPPQAPQPIPTPTPALTLRISGLTTALAPGQTTQLAAEVVGSGAARACAALWGTGDPKIAEVSPDGLLTGRAAGYVNVTASCEGLTTSVEGKVEVLSPYRFSIATYDSDVQTEFGVGGTMTFLDGARAGETIGVGSVFGSDATPMTWPVKVRFDAEDYESKEFVLAEWTGRRRNPMSPIFDFRVSMTFQPDAQTDTFLHTLSRDEMTFAHAFTLRSAGSVRIRTWWSVDYNDLLEVALWCGDTLHGSVKQLFGSAGSGFTRDVPAAGRCEVRLAQSKRDAGTHYRVAIKYAH